MKTFQKFLRFILLFSISFFALGAFPNSGNVIGTNSILEIFMKGQPHTAESSRIFILTNARNGQPLTDYPVRIIDKSNASLVTSARSGESGQVKVKGLRTGKEYHIQVISSEEDSPADEIKKEVSYIHEMTYVSFPIEIHIEQEARQLNVPIVSQRPELPNGCEITALTALLNYHGIEVSKTTMADEHLPQMPFSYQNGAKTGPNPHHAYAGDPRDANSGFYVFADPIVEAANRVIAVHGGKLKAENASGSTPAEILSMIDKKTPVVVWVTLDLSLPVKRGGWHIKETGEFHPSFINLHTVVLDGWEDGRVYVMDPLKGRLSYPEDAFFESYEALGSQAVVIKKPAVS